MAKRKSRIHYSKITPELFLTEYNKGLTDLEIAANLECSPETARKWRSRLGGLPIHVHTGHLLEQKRKVKLSNLEIAAKEAKERGISYGQYMITK